jgi:hypothetical protein
MAALPSRSAGSAGTGAPEFKPEITPEMVRAGVAVLLDGSDLMRALDPTTAEIYVERVLRAAFRAALMQISYRQASILAHSLMQMPTHL